jgi:PD-(D/E)XK endonuclease
MLPPREQGDFGERAALYWLAGRGARISMPFGSNPHYDLVADLAGSLLRVQVKTSRVNRNSRWEVTLCTRGGNQSWNGVSKLLDPAECDYVFALVADGRQWFIPSSQLGGGSGVLLGGPKYADFEVDRGDPIPEASPTVSPLQSASPTIRGDVRVAKGERL